MMISLTQQDILAHQMIVPWPSLRQVEQDLLLIEAVSAHKGLHRNQERNRHLSCVARSMDQYAPSSSLPVPNGLLKFI